MNAGTMEKLKGKIANRRQENALAYADMVRLIAGGKEIAVDKIDGALLLARKSLEDLERDIALYSQRAAWVKDRNRAPKCNDEIAAIDPKLEALAKIRDRAIEDAENQFQLAAAPLQAEREQLCAEYSECIKANPKLAETAAQERREKYNRLAANYERLLHRVQALHIERTNAEGWEKDIESAERKDATDLLWVGGDHKRRIHARVTKELPPLEAEAAAMLKSRDQAYAELFEVGAGIEGAES